MFGKTLANIVAALRAENTDLRQQLRLEREQWSQERLKLLDRLLALTAPGALREVAPRQTPTGPKVETTPKAPRRLNIPGVAFDTYPPLRGQPPSVPDSITDQALSDIVERGKDSDA